MKKIILILFCLISFVCFAQERRTYYMGRLSEEQLKFKDYALGVKVSDGDSLLFASEPLFEIVYFFNNSIVCKLPITKIDGEGDFHDVSSIWICFSEKMRTKFVFPVRTVAVGYHPTGFFIYTTHTGTSGDYWYNIGVVDHSGKVLSSPQEENKSTIYDDVIVNTTWTETTTDISELHVTYISVDGISQPCTIDLWVPTVMMDQIIYDWEDHGLSDEDALFYYAIKDVCDGHIRTSKSKFKSARNNKDNIISKCSRKNIQALRSLKGTSYYRFHVPDLDGISSRK